MALTVDEPTRGFWLPLILYFAQVHRFPWTGLACGEVDPRCPASGIP